MVQAEIAVSPASRALRLLADWGIAETGASTLGELIEEIRDSGESRPEWDEIARIPLSELSTPDRSAQDALENWAKELTPLEQSILWSRTVLDKPAMSLQAVGNAHGTPYTNTWDIQEALKGKLAAFVNAEAGAPIRTKARIVRNTTGIAMKEETANRLLDLDPETNPCRDLVLKVAGPYRQDQGWLVLAEMIPSDPTEDLIDSADENGRLNDRLITYRLGKWGLEPDKHRGWLARDQRMREFGGKLVRWRNNLCDLAIIALDDLGIPATLQEIREHLREDAHPRSLYPALAKDRRLVKAGPKLWALRSWNLPEYLGLPHHMRETVEARGEMPTAELLELMERTYGAKETSLRTLVNKAGLITERGTIRVRNEEDPAPEQEQGLSIL